MKEDTPGLRDALDGELAVLKQTEAELDWKVRSLAAHLGEVRRRKALVEELLAMEVPLASDLRLALPNDEMMEPKTRTPVPSDLSGRNVSDIAYEILLERGKKTMHYEELADAVVKAGGTLGGQTPAQSLIARISRDPRFVRPHKRGWYAASDFYPDSANVGARLGTSARPARRSRRQRRS